MVMNGFPRWLFLLLASALTAACGSSGGVEQGFGSTPLVTVTSASGALQLAVFTNPQPPTNGRVAVRYVITDVASSQPVDGLSMSVVPWMPAMGHGTSVTPAISAVGAGVYDVSNVYLFMPGEWQLRTALTGGANDSAVPSFTVR
jgi:hypothetical protein